MMTIDQLIDKYQKIISTPVESLSPTLNESGETVEVLLQTNLMRILVIRESLNPQTVCLEVEVWLPTRNPNTPDTELDNTETELEDENLSTTLSRIIDHLQYLLKLHQFGFTLDVIKHDCLWTASKSFTETPSRELFELLIPP
ncbi:MAG: hypothetical protein ACFE8O_01585 [Candidatus Hermodarchaeota archaeon]